MVKVEPSSQNATASTQTNKTALAPNDPILRTNQIASVVIQRRTAVEAFPNFAFASVQVAVLREHHGNQKLKALSTGVKHELRVIDLLLNLNSELISLSDKAPVEFNDKIKDILAYLEKENIHIAKGLSGKITKDQFAEMKSHISSQVDKLRTKLQTTISTEIQPEANNLNSIMNIVLQIIQMDGRLKKKTQELPR